MDAEMLGEFHEELGVVCHVGEEIVVACGLVLEGLGLVFARGGFCGRGFLGGFFEEGGGHDLNSESREVGVSDCIASVFCCCDSARVSGEFGCHDGGVSLIGVCKGGRFVDGSAREGVCEI